MKKYLPILNDEKLEVARFSYEVEQGLKHEVSPLWWSKIVGMIKEWLKDNNQTVDMDDKGAVDAKVKEMRRSSKSLIDMNTQQLKLLKLTLK